MKEVKKLEVVQILNLIKLRYPPINISKNYNIPISTLSYTLAKLKKLGCIEKKGYGVWEFIKNLKEVPKVPKGSIKGQIGSSKKEIRGHAFIWKINFFQDYNWNIIVKNYKKRYKKPKLTFQLICNKKVSRTIYNNRKIWLTKNGMIIYEPIDFIGKSSFQAKGDAVYTMDKLVRGFLKELKLKFSYYRFTTSREHYGMVKNELARQYNDRKEKMIIKNEKGTAWLWIDDSKGLGELETNEPVVSRQVQNFWNDHKKHKFEVTPSFVMESINRNAEHLEFHAKNMREHVEVVRKLGNGVEELVRVVKELKK